MTTVRNLRDLGLLKVRQPIPANTLRRGPEHLRSSRLSQGQEARMLASILLFIGMRCTDAFQMIGTFSGANEPNDIGVQLHECAWRNVNHVA